MTQKTLFVIGDKPTVMFFKLLGAQGTIIESHLDLTTALEAINQHLDTIGALLLTETLTATPSKTLDKINRLGIPVISLPNNQSSTSNSQKLEALLEKAIGMKLNKGETHE